MAMTLSLLIMLILVCVDLFFKLINKKIG